MRLDHKLGSLKVGLDADVVVRGDTAAGPPLPHRPQASAMVG